MEQKNPTKVAIAHPAELRRALGPIMATAIVIGNVIGTGVFKKPQAVAENVPDFSYVALVWILGGTIALLGSFAIAEVAVLFPRSGGNYVFLREGFGRLFGFLSGWVDFGIIRSGSIAALATVVSESLHDVLRSLYAVGSRGTVIGYWQERFLTVGFIAILAWVNIRGVRWGGLVQTFMTALKVVVLLGILLLPFLLWRSIDQATSAPTAANVVAFSWIGLGTAMLGVQWAYHGWMNIAQIAEEVRRPQRNIPLSLLTGVFCVTFLYLGANVAFHLVIPMSEMREVKNTTVTAEFCLRLLGPIGAGLAAAAIMTSAFGTLSGNLLVGPRLLFAMGRDQLAPSFLSAIHPRFQTPARAIVVEAVWSGLLVLGGAALSRFPVPVWDISENYELNLNLPPGKQLFDVLTDYAMLGALTFETLAVSTIFVFRWRMPDVERPYRCWGYPVTPILYILILTVVAVNSLLTQRTEAAVMMGFVALGAIIYWVAMRQPVGKTPDPNHNAGF
jgi:basic amino acid/polyamine antiporter, APA family